MNETWKPIVPIKIQTGEIFEPYGYEVSNLGRVRSYRSPKGLVAEPKIISGRPDPNGYQNYHLSNKDNTRRRNIRGHILVMQTFIGYPEAGMMICHWDDVKHNNKLDNLRYGTRQENFNDMIRNKYEKLNMDTLF
ncbi:NUMOD4 [uncultured Caudovirales phage]|uniref:NUMOD4 n=1 Tax=uncultured Caudovirales phage TaxID=2100421 RepID=A0A6J7X0A2_9CAUD|nr:NUMOD4 [uncultured Caudovirales phage]